MKRFLFAVAVVALSACAAVADDQPATGTTTVPATPVITSATPVVVYAPAQTQQRRGLFGRLRNRNTTTMSYSVPTTTSTAAPMAMPMPGTTTPQPMPTIKPAGGITGMPGMLGMLGMPNMVVPATGDLPPGQYTTTDGTIIQIGGTQPMAMPMPTTNTRTGLFGRRNR